ECTVSVVIAEAKRQRFCSYSSLPQDAALSCVSDIVETSKLSYFFNRWDVRICCCCCFTTSDGGGHGGY
ncbi:hypothetical protein ACJMK2_044242, partial [Sinanodonta woodiana]